MLSAMQNHKGRMGFVSIFSISANILFIYLSIRHNMGISRERELLRISLLSSILLVMMEKDGSVAFRQYC